MELGRVGFKERDVADLVALYGITEDAERQELLSLARQANGPTWWYRYGDVVPNWFQGYVGLEGAASLIRTYEVQFIPGLLQTEDYTRAVTVLGHGAEPAAQLNRRISLRMTRQRILRRPHPPVLWAVVDEAALRRPIGGAKVMSAQLKALIEATRRPNIRVQVMPFGAGGHSAAGGSFSILRFPEPELSDIVYVEHLTGATYLDRPEQVDSYMDIIEHLSTEADPPATTAETLARIVEWLNASRS